MKYLTILLLVVGGAFDVCGQTWETAGPPGADVAALTSCSSTILFAATPGGISRSDDAGRTWTRASAGLEGIRADRGVISLAARDCTTVYAGTYSDGLFKSSDGGTTWQAIKPDADFVTALLPTTSGLFAGFSGTISVSVDDGQTWTSVLDNVTVSGLAISPTSAAIYAATWNKGLLVSYDAGRTWVDAGITPRRLMNAVAVAQNGAVFAADGNAIIYVASGDHQPWRAIDTGLGFARLSSIACAPLDASRAWLAHDNHTFTTSDGGLTWTAANTGLPDIVIFALLPESSSPLGVWAGTAGDGLYRTDTASLQWRPLSAIADDTRINQIRTDPLRASVAYAATQGSGLWRTTDAGATWQAAVPATAAATFTQLAFDTQTGTVYAASSMGLLRSDDAVTWTPLPTGPVYAVAVDPVSGTVYTGTGGTLLLSKDRGSSWTTVTYEGPIMGFLQVDAQQHVYIEDGLGLFVSSDGGNTWGALVFGDVMGKVAFDPLVPQRIYVAGVSSVLRTDDAGMTWQEFPVLFNDSSRIMSLTPDATIRDTVYIGIGIEGDLVPASGAGTTATMLPRGRANVRKSVNAGASWVTIGNDLSVAATVASVAVSPHNPGLIYAATHARGVFTLQQHFVRGDANGDNRVDAADIFFLINALFANGPAPAWTADANADGQIGAPDIFFLLSYLFAGGPPPQPLEHARHSISSARQGRVTARE